MEEVLLELAKIGGPVVCVIAINAYKSFKREQMFNKTMNNHLAHETASRDKLTEALTSLTEVVRNCPKKK